MSTGGSVIIDTRERRGLVAGLTWASLSISNSKRRKSLIKAAASEMGASKIVAYGSAEVVTVGGYLPVDDDLELDLGSPEDGKKPKKPNKLYSLAAAFAQMVGDGSAVLVLGLGKNRSVVVSVSAGNPTLDMVVEDEEAQAIASRHVSGQMGLDYVLYTNTDYGSFGGAQPVTFDMLWEEANAKTQLVSPPINLVLILSVLTALGVLALSASAYNDYREAKLRKARQAEMAAKNPLPKYKFALSVKVKRMGVDRDVFIAAMDKVMAQPMSVVGWDVKEIDCLAQESVAKCVYKFKRRDGTSERLLAAMSHMEAMSGSESPLEEMHFAAPVEMPFSGLSDRSEIVKKDELLTKSIPIWQHWANAGINAAALDAKSEPWPETPNVDLRRLPAGAAVMRSEVKIDVPLGLEREVVSSAPPNIWWNGFTITVNNDAVKLNLKGYSYVD